MEQEGDQQPSLLSLSGADSGPTCAPDRSKQRGRDSLRVGADSPRARSRRCPPFLGQKAQRLWCPWVGQRQKPDGVRGPAGRLVTALLCDSRPGAHQASPATLPTPTPFPGGQARTGADRADDGRPAAPESALGRHVPTGGSGPARVNSGVCGFATSACALAKFYTDPVEAVKDVSDGEKIMVGGFGVCGIPENLIGALLEARVKDWIVVSSNGGERPRSGPFTGDEADQPRHPPPRGRERALRAPVLGGQAGARADAPGHPGRARLVGGAGVPAFHTPTASGILVQEGGAPVRCDQDSHIAIMSQPGEVREFHQEHYLLEHAITADFALVKEWKADRAGNAIFKGSARNFFNVPMCKAAETSVVEVEEIIVVGSFAPEDIQVPNIYVDRVILGARYEKRIKHLKIRTEEEGKDMSVNDPRARITKRAALEFEDGMYASLGVGIPFWPATTYSPNVTAHSQ